METGGHRIRVAANASRGCEKAIRINTTTHARRLRELSNCPTTVQLLAAEGEMSGPNIYFKDAGEGCGGTLQIDTCSYPCDHKVGCYQPCKGLR
jgi:hypothetical protein